MKKIKWLITFVTMLLIVTCVFGNNMKVKAVEKSIAISGAEEKYIVKPGEVSNIKIPIIAKGGYLTSPSLKVEPSDGAPFTITNAKLVYASTDTEVTGIGTNAPVNAEFDVNVNDGAKMGAYGATLIVSYIDYGGDSLVTVTAKLNIYLNVMEEKAPSQLTVSNLSYSDAIAGSDTDLKFLIKNEGELTAYNVFFSVDYENSKLDIGKRYTTTNVKVGNLASGESQSITLPVSILTTATAGKKKLTINFTYKNFGDTANTTSSYDITVNVKQNEVTPKTPYLQFEDLSYKGNLKPGKSFVLKAILRNDGDSKASNVKVSVDEASINKDSILKEYLTDGITTSNISKDETQMVEIPLSVSKQSTGGLTPIKVNVNYSDDSGTSYQLSQTIYLDVIGEQVKTDLPNLLISNVGQNKSQPQAGDRIDIHFDIENKGLVDASEVKIATTNLSSTTFIPVDSEPYIYINKLKAGEKKTISIPLIISEHIPEGLSYVAIQYSYAGEGTASTFQIPVKDVVNETGNVSKPKLIVSKYVTDVEQLRAGSTFNFTFDLYNTNASVAAKNITVTISQAENIFSVTQGSNSFFINKMGPGETVQKTLEMRVKVDATTKAYPLEITIEYEYDGAEPNPTTGEIGESKTEKLNLQAVENSRPVADNISVYSWDGQVTVGNPAMLGLDFYNMGKSPLNNIIFYVEGDFVKANGSMFFQGSVAASASTYVEFDVIPNVEGVANGVLRITFEDSNGDLIETTKEFSTEVFPAQIFDPGMGGYDPGLEEVMNPGSLAKKPILQTWLFIAIQVVVFIVFIPVTRKIIISIYKAKLLKKEERQYE